jgi:hypothetical protein
MPQHNEEHTNISPYKRARMQAVVAARSANTNTLHLSEGTWPFSTLCINRRSLQILDNNKTLEKKGSLNPKAFSITSHRINTRHKIVGQTPKVGIWEFFSFGTKNWIFLFLFIIGFFFVSDTWHIQKNMRTPLGRRDWEGSHKGRWQVEAERESERRQTRCLTLGETRIIEVMCLEILSSFAFFLLRFWL